MGTSGFRADLVRGKQRIFSAQQARMSEHARRLGCKQTEQSSQDWLSMLDGLFAQLTDFLPQVNALIADGTSSTLVGVDAYQRVIEPAIMYNDSRALKQAASYQALLDPDSPAQGAQSSLAKALWLTENTSATQIWHQLDWLYAHLLAEPNQLTKTKQSTYSDINTQLKMGVDLQQLSWPDAIQTLAKWPLAQPVLPGQLLGSTSLTAQKRWDLPANCQIYAGTTDSIASFLATPASQPGDLVISLGSTLAFKLISKQPHASAQHGIYSHRLGDTWLVGGASNAGGAVYQQRFLPEQLSQLSQQLAGISNPQLARYPLTQVGERFPIADARFPASRFDDLTDEMAFISITEGLVALEQAAYDQFHKMGLPIKRIFSIGGGLRNQAWQLRRMAQFGDTLAPLPDPDAPTNTAAFGVTRLITDHF